MLTMSTQFTDDDKRFIAGEIRKGVKYMHHHDPVVIHQDLKPQNVLVSISDCFFKK